MTITLAQVIAQVETRSRPWSVRFEPAVFARYKSVDDGAPSVLAQQIKAVELLHGCTPDTARVLLSMSWGRYQMMGFNLSGINVLQFVADPDSQDAKFRVFAMACGASEDQLADASWLRTDPAAAFEFATRYNGPGQPETYMGEMQAAYYHLGGS